MELDSAHVVYKSSEMSILFKFLFNNYFISNVEYVFDFLHGQIDLERCTAHGD